MAPNGLEATHGGTHLPNLKLSSYVVDIERFRATLRGRREELELSMLQLGEKAGVAPATVHKLEAGKLTVHLDKFLRIVDALRIPLSDLISFDGSTIPEPPDPLALELARLLRSGDQSGVLQLLAHHLKPGAGKAEKKAVSRTRKTLRPRA